MISHNIADFAPRNFTSHNYLRHFFALLTGLDTRCIVSESRDPTNELRQVTVPIVSQKECTTDYGTGTITDRMLCAGDVQGGKDSCMGDAGDPLVIKRDNVWEVQGIASWGRGCAEKGFPGVYTRVTQLIDWIKQRL